MTPTMTSVVASITVASMAAIVITMRVTGILIEEEGTMRVAIIAIIVIIWVIAVPMSGVPCGTTR